MVETGEAAENPQNDGRNSSPQRDKSQQEKNNKTKGLMALLNPSDYWMIFFTGVLAFSSICTLGAVIYQGLVAKSQWAEMKRTSEASEKAAKAAENSIAQARVTARLDQRAWVSTMTITGSVPIVDKEFSVDVLIKNNGKTFARAVTVNCRIRSVDSNQPPPDFAGIEAEDMGGIPSIALLAPGGQYGSGASNSRKVTQDSVDKFISGKERVFVFGKITYRDVFDCPHWTTFCSILKTDGIYQVWGAYNDADDNRCP
jgi:hypothetical protein